MNNSGSGANFVLICRKFCSNAEEQYNWLKNSETKKIPVIKVYNCNKDYYDMEYLMNWNCLSLEQYKTKENIIKVCNIIKQMKGISLFVKPRFNTYIERLNIHAYNESFVKHEFPYTSYLEELKKYENYFNENSSYYHGDLTLQNILIHPIKKEIKLIDPNCLNNVWGSWLLDVSKLYQSLHLGYENIFRPNFDDFFVGIETYEYPKLINEINNFFKFTEEEVKAVLLLEISHYIRMYKYKNNEDKEKVIKILEILWNEYLSKKIIDISY